MEHITIVHSRVSMNLSEAGMRKMHSLAQKNLINIEYYFNQNMSLAGDPLKQHITLSESMLVVSDVQQRHVYLNQRRSRKDLILRLLLIFILMKRKILKLRQLI